MEVTGALRNELAGLKTRITKIEEDLAQVNENRKRYPPQESC